MLVVFLAPVRERLSDVLFSAEVELAVTPDEVEPEPLEVLPDEVSDSEPAREAAPVRVRTPRPPPGAITPAVVATVSILPEATAIVPPSVAPLRDDDRRAEERERERLRIASVLSAERYARDSVIAGDPGPTRRGPPAGGGDREGGLAPATAMLSEAEAEAAHSGHLRETAMARAWLTHTPIVPREQPDGSWVYAGPLFTARIAPDGAVSYSDRDAVSYDLGTGTGGFDLTDMMMGAAGADPAAAERERFMEETEELRVRLENGARAADTTRVLGRARGRLVRILGDEARSIESRRRSIFNIWDECDDGDEGRAMRDAVLAFIRSDLPEGSENAYPPSEIAGLNATRQSTESFAPY